MKKKVRAVLVPRDGEDHTIEDAEFLLDAEVVLYGGKCYVFRHESAEAGGRPLLTFIEPITAELKEPVPKFDGTLRCPHCGSEEVEWQEYVLHTRQILGVRDGEVCVDMNTEKQVYEVCKDEALSCKSCFAEFQPPEGLSVYHCDRNDYEQQEAVP